MCLVKSTSRPCPRFLHLAFFPTHPTQTIPDSHLQGSTQSDFITGRPCFRSMSRAAFLPHNGIGSAPLCHCLHMLESDPRPTESCEVKFSTISGEVLVPLGHIWIPSAFNWRSGFLEPRWLARKMSETVSVSAEVALLWAGHSLGPRRRQNVPSLQHFLDIAASSSR